MVRTGSAGRSEIVARIERALSAHRRPLALVGRSGCGKTTLLRTALDRPGIVPRWTTARDLADTMVDAIRRDAQTGVFAALAREPRPLVVEHLEDLRGRPRTLEELRRLLEARTHLGGAVFLTLTTRPGTSGLARWLARRADVARPAFRPTPTARREGAPSPGLGRAHPNDDPAQPAELP